MRQGRANLVCALPGPDPRIDSARSAATSVNLSGHEHYYAPRGTSALDGDDCTGLAVA